MNETEDNLAQENLYFKAVNTCWQSWAMYIVVLKNAYS